MRRVGIVYPRDNLDTVPSLVGAAEMFAERGYAVDLFTRSRAGQPEPEFASPRIRIQSLGTDGLAEHSTAGLRSVVKRAGWLPDAARAPLALGYRALGAGLAHGSRFAARARSAVANQPEPFTCVIGVDPDGLALARALAPGVPLGYYSLELLLSYELTGLAEEQLKAQERALSRQAAFVIVQDAARARLLSDDNDLSGDKLVLVPNAPPGPARRQPSNYWHTRFDLPSQARVVLHSGSLGDWTGIQPILDSAADWPAPWVLVIHTRYDAESSAYVEGLRQRKQDPRRVLFSLRPVPRQDYDALIDGAQVGLAFYVPTGDSSFTQRNVQTIGLSSGKLAYYLRAGLPVIVNRAASIAESIDASRCGIAVDDARGIGGALDYIGERYDHYSAAACGFFEKNLDFRGAFAAVVDRVDALA